MLESMRREGKPIRLVLLKARQWGGSTCVQIYMGWLQLVHSVGLNSLIIAHQGIATDEIKGMFDRMLAKYPDWLLTDADGEQVKGKRLEGAGYTKGTYRVRARDCKVKLGSAERLTLRVAATTILCIARRWDFGRRPSRRPPNRSSALPARVFSSLL